MGGLTIAVSARTSCAMSRTDFAGTKEGTMRFEIDGSQLEILVEGYYPSGIPRVSAIADGGQRVVELSVDLGSLGESLHAGQFLIDPGADNARITDALLVAGLFREVGFARGCGRVAMIWDLADGYRLDLPPGDPLGSRRRPRPESAMAFKICTPPRRRQAALTNTH